MSKGMLGKLPLSAIRGPRDDFEEKLAGEDGEVWLVAFNQFLRKQNPWPIVETYAARFTAAIKACACHYNSPELTTEFFGEDVFGTLGEGYVLAQPPMTEVAKERGHWIDSEIDAWHASAEVVGEGFERSYLVDLAKYGETNPKEQVKKVIVCWRAGKNARVACLGRDDSERHFYVDGRGGGWYFGCWFLLRKVKMSTDADYAARFAAAIAAGGFTWWNQERLTAANFPGETFAGGDYNLKYRELPSKSGGYNWSEIVAVVAEWARTDPTVQGGATAGDGLYYAAEVNAGRRDQPNGWIVCPASASVGGELLCLHRGDARRKAFVHSRGLRWYDGDFVLLREVLPIQL